MSSNGKEIVLLINKYQTPQRNLRETLGACFPAEASSRERGGILGPTLGC